MPSKQQFKQINVTTIGEPRFEFIRIHPLFLCATGGCILRPVKSSRLGAGFLVVFPIGAELVVLLPFLRIAEHLVGIIDLQKLFIGCLVAPGFVGMILDGKLAIGRLDLLGRCGVGNTQYFIIVFIIHFDFFKAYRCFLLFLYMGPLQSSIIWSYGLLNFSTPPSSSCCVMLSILIPISDNRSIIPAAFPTLCSSRALL